MWESFYCRDFNYFFKRIGLLKLKAIQDNTFEECSLQCHENQRVLWCQTQKENWKWSNFIL